MTTKYNPAIHDRLLDFLVEKSTPQEILAFSLTEEEQQRADYLQKRHKAGKLTADEQAELDHLLKMDEWLGLLQARAREVVGRLPAVPTTSVPDNRREDLVRTLIHDIKGPIGGILGWAELLKTDSTLDSMGKQGVQEILATGERILAILGQVIDMRKMSRGPCDLKGILNKAHIELQGVANVREIRLILDLPAEGCHILADESMLFRMARNLMSSAIRNTSMGRELKIFLRHDEAGVVLRMQKELDTQLEDGQAFHSGVHRNPFAGLEMTMARIIAEAHGGTMEATTRHEIATEFVVTFPASMLVTQEQAVSQ